MDLAALVAIAGASIASTLYGLISSWIKRTKAAEKAAEEPDKKQYTITVEEGGVEVEYRIESDNRQQAEETIRKIIEKSA